MSQFRSHHEEAYGPIAEATGDDLYAKAHDLQESARGSKTYTHEEMYRADLRSGEHIEKFKGRTIFDDAADITAMVTETRLHRLVEKLDKVAREQGREIGAFGNSSQASATSWHDGHSVEDTVRHSEEGWDAGLEKMFKAIEDIEAEGGFSRVPDIMTDVAGDDVNVANYAKGQPENMNRYIWPETDPPREIHISANMTIAAQISTEAAINRGAALAHAVDVIESSGDTRVKITGYFVMEAYDDDSEDRRAMHVIRFPIKEAGHSMVLSRLTMALAHPCMTRRVMFAAMEDRSIMYRAIHEATTNGGYSRPGYTPEHMRGEIHFDSLKRSRDAAKYQTPEKARRNVGEIFAEAGYDLR